MSYSLSCGVCLEVSIIKDFFLIKKKGTDGTIDNRCWSFLFCFLILEALLYVAFHGADPSFSGFHKIQANQPTKKPLSIICQQSTNQFLPPRVSFFLLPSPPPNKKYFKCFCWPFPPSSTPTFCQDNSALSVVG